MYETTLEERAWHEAGHGLIAILNGRTLDFITIDKEKCPPDAGGFSQSRHSQYAYRFFVKKGDGFTVNPRIEKASERRIEEIVAGRAAHAVLLAGRGEEMDVIIDDDDDVAQATQIAIENHLCPEAEVMKYVVHKMDQVAKRLARHYGTLSLLAGELQKRKTLTGKEVRAIMYPGPPLTGPR